jgi:hypothetical protein
VDRVMALSELIRRTLHLPQPGQGAQRGRPPV